MFIDARKHLRRLLFLSIFGLPFALTPALARAHVVDDWNAIAQQAIVVNAARPGAVAVVEFAYVHIAIYDAVNAIDGRYSVFAVQPLSSPIGGSPEAAGATAGTGFVPMESSPISTTGNWADQFLNGVTFQTTGETGASTALQFRGTGVIALLRISPQAGQILATIDGEPLDGWPKQDGAALIDLSAFQAQDLPIELANGLDDSMHTLTLSLAGPGQFTIGGLVVSREPPLLWPVIILIVIALGIVAAGLRDVIYVIALHVNVLQRRIGVDLRPPLPRLPDWRPARRF